MVNTAEIVQPCSTRYRQCPVPQATKVDGVYDCDPKKNPDALLHRMLSYGDVRTRKLSVMDETAITLCKENNIPVVVFNLTTPGNILRAVTGDDSIGTTVCDTLVSCLRPMCRFVHHI